MILDDIDHLKETVQYLKKNKLTIGCITGSFDLLHEGHKYAIEHCKSKVDKLFVLLNSDDSIKKYKGPNRPVENQEIRIDKINSYDKDCYYFIFDNLIPNKFLEVIQPNIYFLSEEWSTSPVESLVLDKTKTKITSHPFLPGFSTTNKVPKENISLGAIFLDRDGTINEDLGYISEEKDLFISNENKIGLQNLAKLEFKIFIITNQSGVSKNYFSEATLLKLNKFLLNEIHGFGGRIDDVYYDTSSSDNPSINRKPNIGMVEKAVKEYKVALSKSWIIGDKATDIMTGKFSNMKTIYIENSKYTYNSNLEPDYKASNLYDAYKIIKNYLEK